MFKNCFVMLMLAGTVMGQDAATERAKAAAMLLPDGPQKDAVLAALAAPGKVVPFLEKIGVDRNGEWSNAELKKVQVGQVFGALTHVPLKDGRNIAVGSITTLTPAGLRWIGDGIDEAHWTLLPEVLVNAYGFSPAREAAYVEWKKGSNQIAAQHIAKVKSDIAMKERSAVNNGDKVNEIMKGRVAVSLRVSQALEGGALCYGARIESNAYWGRWEGMRWVAGLTVADEHDEPVYVVGLPETTVDGDRTAGWLYPCGVYRYTTVSGSSKAVRKYATSAELAVSEAGRDG